MIDDNKFYITNGVTQDGFGARMQRCLQVMCLVYELQEQGYSVEYVHTPFSYNEDTEINEDRSLGISIRSNFSLANPYPYDDIDHDGYMNRSTLWDAALSFNDKTVYQLDLNQLILKHGYDKLTYDLSNNNTPHSLYIIKYLHSEYDSNALNINNFQKHRNIILNSFGFFKNLHYNKKEIAIHIRRKDILDKTYRYIDDSTYLQILSELERIKSEYDITIYTQKVGFELQHYTGWNVVLDTEIEDFDVFKKFITANHLITGASTFSYSAGLLNPNTVVHHNIGHIPLTNWIDYNTYINLIKQL